MTRHRQSERRAPVAGRAPIVVLATAMLAAAFTAAMVVPAPARAGGCCASAGLGGVGRLMLWEKGAVGARVAWSGTHGWWDHRGTWTPSIDDTRDREIRTELWGMGRVGPRSALWLSVPYVRQLRAGGGLEERGGGFGDLSAGWRHQFLEIGSPVPGVATNLSLRAPTGRPTDRSRTTLGTDVTTRGSWQAGASLQVEWVVSRWFARVDVGGTYDFPDERSDNGVTQRFGPALSVGATGGLEVTPELVVAPTLTWTIEGPLRVDGEVVENSGQHELRAGLSSSWRFHAHWTAQLSLDSSIPTDGLGRNRFGRTTGTVGLRYGAF